MLVLVRNVFDLFMLVLVRSFSYIPLASFTDELYTPEFLLHSCSTPDANFIEEILIHSSYCFSEEFLLHSLCYF